MAEENPVPPGKPFPTPDAVTARPSPAAAAANNQPSHGHGEALANWVGYLVFAVIAAVVVLVLYLGVGYNIWKSSAYGILSGFLGLGIARFLFPRLSHKLDVARPAVPTNVDSTREVVETVVFVVVLVLMLKSFVAEAFVIPTGSMAETLWGYQKVVTCPKCSIMFPVNCSEEVDPQDGRSAIAVTQCICPNCRQDLKLVKNPTNEGEALDPGPTTGDRVLVAKFLYDLVNRLPDRLDVVVFKFPGDGSFPRSGPYKMHTPMNYIKRLIGLPGETIAICGGKLYVLPADKSPKHDDAASPGELWQFSNVHYDDPDAIEKFKNKEFQILRKGPENILSMMRLVYDNDHPAKDLQAAKWQRWSGDGWTADKEHGFHRATGDTQNWLRYQHIIRGNVKPELITDFLGYNSARKESKNWVGDLILECEVAIDQPQGELTLELAHGVDRFQAQWNLADGVCTLYRISNSDKTPKKLDSKQTGLKQGKHRLRFANVDQRLVLWIDDKLVLWTNDKKESVEGVVYDAPSSAKPTENDLAPAGIGVKGPGVHVKDLKLFRDVYYAYRRDNRGKDWNFALDDPAKWGEVGEPPAETYYIQPNHFLCLGDNSNESSDGREWGLVPRRLLLGRALTVYYPFYFPFWPLQSQVNRVGLIH